MSTILRACVLLILALATLPGRHAVTTAAPGRLDSTDLRLLRTASRALGSESRRHVMRWLLQQPQVSEARLGLDRQTVDILYRDGSRASILPAAMTDAPLPVPALQPRIRTLSMSHDPVRRALVMEPFAAEQMGVTAGIEQIKDLKAAGFQVDSLYDQAVTIQSMKSMANYDIVYIHTHGGVNSYGEAVIESGQQVVGDDPTMDQMISKFEVFSTGVAGSDKIYYGIMSRFILDYLGQFPPNSMMIVNTCSLLNAGYFWKALQLRGLSTLVSWDQEPIIPDALVDGDHFFDLMAQGMSVSEAIASGLTNGYGTSTYQDPTTHKTVTAHLQYAGDGLITFQGLSSGPLFAYPYPVPTPYVVPTLGIAPPPPPGKSAPTPPPSATPTPIPLPLQVSVRQKVAPGSEQVITAHSQPNTPIHIAVTYPGGDQTSADRIADDSGLATYSYVQPSNEIEHNLYNAQVVVTAGDGRQYAATVTKTYRIGFGRLDVAVAPVTGSPAQLLTIWVHTTAHTRVNVTLQTGTTTLSHLKGVTDAQGWAHVQYKPASSGTIPSHLAVVIHASMQSRGTTYSTRATFLTP